jgi:heptosyltransferase-2
MTTPALERLREARPRSHITLLTHEKLVDLWRHLPALDAVLTFADRESLWRVGRRLRVRSFQTGLLFPNSPRSALELWLAGVPERIGYAQRGRAFLLSKGITRPSSGSLMRKRSIREIRQSLQFPSGVSQRSFSIRNHHIHDYLNLVAALGGNPEPIPPRLVVTPAEVDDFRRKFGIFPSHKGHAPVFGLNPGAEYGPAKRWPKERFIETAVQVQRQTDCCWLVFGGKADLTLAGEIAAEIEHRVRQRSNRPENPKLPSVLNLSGATNLRELCAGLKLCRVLLTNDTGPMHVAAALETPVVVPFGSTSPELTGPGLPGDPRHQLLKSNAACAPCFLRACPIDFRCMHGITINRVVEAVLVAASELRSQS